MAYILIMALVVVDVILLLMIGATNLKIKNLSYKLDMLAAFVVKQFFDVEEEMELADGEPIIIKSQTQTTERGDNIDDK